MEVDQTLKLLMEILWNLWNILSGFKSPRSFDFSKYKVLDVLLFLNHLIMCL